MHKKLLPNYLAPLFLGLLGFFLFCSHRLLDVSDIGWITAGDTAQQYLGWQLFRFSPWTNPLGLNPLFGHDLGNSIVYSDSIPLMAFLFKPFSEWLPSVFQYMGIWILACFLLQALLAWKLLSIFTSHFWLLLLGTGLLICSPIFLSRIGFHNNLCGHFLLLGAFILTFSRPTDSRHIRHTNIYLKHCLWLGLVTLAELTNFYFFIMIFGMWFGAWLDDMLYPENTINKMKMSLFLPIMLCVAGLVGWHSGYFVAGASISQGQYGISRINLLSPLDPQGWSYLLPNIPGAFSSAESFTYLGLGTILTLLLGIYCAFQSKQQLRLALARHRFFILILIGFTLFALTNQLELGPWHWHYPLPEVTLKIGTIARQSSRLFMPVVYFLSFVSIVLIIRTLKIKLAISFLLFFLCVQVIDTSAGWLPLRKSITQRQQPAFDNFLANPAWTKFPEQYQRILRIPAESFYANWEAFATYAWRHNMSTNSVYLARVDARKLDAMNAQFERAIATGQYDPHSLYIVDDEKVLPILMHLDASKDLFAKINGINVLAPGWKTCRTCPQVPAEMEIHSVIPPVILGQTIHFSRAGQGKYFLVGIGAWQIVGWGWSYPEAFGTWSEGKFAKIVMPLPEGAKTLALEMRALISPNLPQQTIGVYVDRKLQQTAVLTKDQGNLIEIALPPKAVDKDYVTIELRFSNQAKPKDLGLGDDIRDLAIGLVSGVVR
jgi:hypothetical protein